MTVPGLKVRMLHTFLALMFSSVLSVFAQEKPRRPLTPDDLFRLEELGQVALSPDGQWLAYVIRRPKSTALVHSRPFLEGNDRADVWLVSTSGGRPQNLTNGLGDGSGWWSPVWSPDGQRLALLSTRGGNVRLWLWEKATGRLKQLTERGVDIPPGQQVPFAWLNNQQLVCPVLPEGQKPNLMTVEMRAAEIAMREWLNAWSGKKTTVSVLESGVALPLGQRPQGQLLLIDVAQGSRPLTTGFSFRDLRLSPDRQHIAVLKQIDVVRPVSNRLLAPGRPQGIYQANVFGRDGRQVLPDISVVREAQAGSLRWSPDGRSLALVGLVSSDGPRAITCALPGGTCQPLSLPDEEPASVIWSSGGSLLMLPKGKPGERQDWWALSPANDKRNLTAKMKTVPVELGREAGGESFIGLADGDLWRIHLDGHEAQNLTESFEPKIASIIWPTPLTDEADELTQLIVGVRRGAQTDWHHIELSSRRITSISKPTAASALVGFSPRYQRVVTTARDQTGTYLWLSRAPFEQFLPVVETNTHLREVAQTEYKKIEYRSTEGRELKAWVLLPVGYQPGKSYPLITVVYAGNVFTDNPPGGMFRTINSASSLNYHLLAAHGYAVLFPSIPLKPEGEASDPYLELTKGVMPAIDKVIEQGIADPKRLGVLGQSYGGYATYGLITQTNRFQAAVSLAGLSDLISLYGIFDARFRYDQYAHERVSMMSLAEAGQLRMGNPPWKDSERYMRNSPLFYVDRIETPLMIVQGDLDYVAMQQGEQVFTALYRQNKRAMFVRYWGEGHVLESPANIRDLWGRIYGWFDQFLQPQSVSTK